MVYDTKMILFSIEVYIDCVNKEKYMKPKHDK